MKCLPKKKLLIISDPLIGGSVQLNFLSNIISKLVGSFSIDVYSSFVDGTSKYTLKGISVIGKQRSLMPYRIYRTFFGNNEAALWAYSWIVEFLFKRNSSDVERYVNRQSYDFILNISQTIPANSNIYWGQSVPLDQTLIGMRPSTPILKIIPRSIIKMLGKIDKKFIGKIAKKGNIVITNSNYTRSIYESLGVKVDGVVYSVPDLLSFKPSLTKKVDKFVLAYIGKETEVDTILEIARRGVRIISFGAKIPNGGQIGRLKTLTEFRGYVSKNELIDLYSNAIFTLFPFTYEPFGYVPLESISCGTPVLTYSKQGPAETIIEGVSGWLANSRDSLIEMAVSLWNSNRKMIITADVQNAARNFSKFGSYPEISELLMVS